MPPQMRLSKQIMRHSLCFGAADGIPFGDVRRFVLLVVKAQLGALGAFHVFLRVLALEQKRGITDTIVELRSVTDRFAVLQAAGFDATGEYGLVVGGPGVWAGGMGLNGKGGEAEKSQCCRFHGQASLGQWPKGEYA